MEQSSEFPGPSPDDYANVLALNKAFIRTSFQLKGPQRGRLAATPFLLFSVREDDLAWWDEALIDKRQGDLMPEPDLESPDLRQLQTATLSFLWQLARSNPYAVRVISGATVAWCEKISELQLVVLLNRIGQRGDLIMSRLDNSDLSRERLLDCGTSSQKSVRRSSQLAALQSLLTRVPTDDYERLPAAACAMLGPMRVRDKKK